MPDYTFIGCYRMVYQANYTAQAGENDWLRSQIIDNNFSLLMVCLADEIWCENYLDLKKSEESTLNPTRVQQAGRGW